MRSPEHRSSYTNRTSQNYDNEVSSRYKTPGAFTILPPEDVVPPDPPAAPQPYRLTPSSKRHKNMSFAILAEPSSVPGSRSPSPTGRVSPFRGRGFNPIGSRHASPVPSPPPEEGPMPISDSPHHSKIPKLSRRGSATAFGEKITDYQSSPNRRKLNAQLSQSLTNIAPRRVSNRPPPSPRRPQGLNKTVAFQRLSPIVGSSPEPSQSQSSPKYPNTSSQSQNKFRSPGRSQSFVNRPPRGASRPTSKAASRNASREPSPSKNPTSPTRIPVKSYKNVQAKVNSFSRVKPKVPPKPQVLNEETEDSDNVVQAKRRLDRKESVTLRTNSKTNVIPKSVGSASNKNNNNSKNNNKNVTKDSNDNNVNSKSGSSSNGNRSSSVNKSGNGTKPNNSSNNNESNKNSKDEDTNGNKKNEEEKITTAEDSSETETNGVKKSESLVKLSDLLQPSTTAVVSSTTTTVTQPLKIDAKFDITDPVPKSDNKTIAPMVDGRVLSATSVSNAMNKMNDTVLNTQTLMKESGLTKLTPATTAKESTVPKLSPAVSTKESKLSPAASTIISMSSETKPPNPALDTKNATTALPTVETITTKTEGANNHVTSTGIVPARVLEQHVQNNMSKLISPEHAIGNSVQKSVNDRIIEARTVVAHDVKPIRITVKEKPMDVEVQSGNIRFDTTNGLNERPG
ncbi:hypothetical protein BDFB_003408 [Asbolus verrucosus]|uniref:Uncharacterized protein n=1 Tax=Asbolus verrucosus TaxID=1661398 RepID=A0A482VNE1_ASBVE|nr:hypothetical protein BDFB_003408 [Asbolus verrucosus]